MHFTSLRMGWKRREDSIANYYQAAENPPWILQSKNLKVFGGTKIELSGGLRPFAPLPSCTSPHTSSSIFLQIEILKIHAFLRGDFSSLFRLKYITDHPEGGARSLFFLLSPLWRYKDKKKIFFSFLSWIFRMGTNFYKVIFSFVILEAFQDDRGFLSPWSMISFWDAAEIRAGITIFHVLGCAIFFCMMMIRSNPIFRFRIF